MQLSALHCKTNGNVELRVVEVEGERQEATLTLGFPSATAEETNLLGGKVGDAALKDGVIRTSLKPWEVRTFALR